MQGVPAVAAFGDKSQHRGAGSIQRLLDDRDTAALITFDARKELAHPGAAENLKMTELVSKVHAIDEHPATDGGKMPAENPLGTTPRLPPVPDSFLEQAKAEPARSIRRYTHILPEFSTAWGGDRCRPPVNTPPPFIAGAEAGKFNRIEPELVRSTDYEGNWLEAHSLRGYLVTPSGTAPALFLA